MGLTMFGPFVFDAVQAGTHSKGYHQMVHRTDEGFAVGQHGGEDLDRIELSFLLWNELRGTFKQVLEGLANLGIPLPFVTQLPALSSFTKVRVTNFSFTDVAGRTSVTQGKLSLQRVLVGRLDRVLTFALGAARLAGTLVSIDSQEAVNMITKATQTSIASPILQPKTVWTYRGGVGVF